MEFSIGPLIALLVKIARAFVPSRVSIHRKSSDDHNVQFWIVHEPKYPGEPLWAVATICGQRDRISVFWPSNQLELPWGIKGDPEKSCYCPLYSAAYIQSAISLGEDRYRLLDDERLDELARSKWGTTPHMRAGLQVERNTRFKLFGDWMRIRIVGTDNKTRAATLIRPNTI